MANNTKSCSSGTVATANTGVREIKFGYKWSLTNSPSETTYSQIFSPQGYENYQWKIRLEFKLGKHFLYLHFVGPSPEAKAHFRFVINKGLVNGEQLFVSPCLREIVNFEPNEWSGFDHFCWPHNSNYRPNELIIIIECKVYLLIEDENCRTLKNSQNELVQKFGSLLDRDKFSDVKLVVGNHELSAHKAILAVRSEVFAAMFQHEMEESKSNRITITDFEPEVMKEMLHFIYTGEASNLAEMAGDLLAAADKYALQNLKQMCEISLCNQLSAETSIQTLILADRHGVDDLKSKAMVFICIHAAEIMNTQTWKNAVAEQSNLITMELSRLIISKILKVDNQQPFK